MVVSDPALRIPDECLVDKNFVWELLGMKQGLPRKVIAEDLIQYAGIYANPIKEERNTKQVANAQG